MIHRSPLFAAMLLGAIAIAWWKFFLMAWGHIDDAVDDKNGLLETDWGHEFDVPGAPNADGD